jgi:hypothetical protein
VFAFDSFSIAECGHRHDGLRYGVLVIVRTGGALAKLQ